jgi:hypothetical protein
MTLSQTSNGLMTSGQKVMDTLYVCTHAYIRAHICVCSNGQTREYLLKGKDQ